MTPLADRNCQHRSSKDPLPSRRQISSWLAEIDSWNLNDGEERQELSKTFHFPDFSKGLEFASQIGRLADEQDHHPRISIEWGRVRIDWWTHTLNGPSENDFIMAAKVDRLFPSA